MRPQFLQTNEGAEYTNIDSLAGSLVPVKAKTRTTEVLDAFHAYYRAKDIWVSQAEPTDFLEYNKKLYYTNRKSKQVVFDGDATFNISIVAPTKLVDLVVAPTPTGLAGVIQYAMTFVNQASGVESTPSPISTELDLTGGGSVTFTNLPTSTDPQVTRKRLYRLGNNLTTLTRVAELAFNTASYTDSLDDLSIEGSVLTTASNGVVPSTIAYFTEMRAMLYGAVANKLMFTNIGEPWNWPASNYLLFDDDITGIASTANGLLVHTEFRTHLVTGTGPSTLATQLLSGDQGCVAFESIASIGQVAMWASTAGVCLSNGSEVIVVSKDKLGPLNLTPLSAVAYDEVYYLSNSDGTILAFDFSLGKIFKTFSINVSMLAVAKGKLYGWKANTQYELFSATTTEQFTYLSPRFIEGRATELKTYKKVYIYSKGVIIIDIIIDDEVVATGSFDGEDSHMIQVPQDKQRGFFVQFRVQGTGEVYEIEYVVGDRVND